MLFIMPIAASSAIMADMVSALVSPGTAIISSPTEQTQVIASSLSMHSAPSSTAEIMPASSDTGIKAPESPPTWLEAITPPFFTASFSSASAAVVPCVPHFSSPMISSISATLSPTAGVGASERSTTPNGTPRRRDASCATSSPIRVILNAVFFIVSATTSNGCPLQALSACATTPGPDTPTFITHSGSPTPWNAPAMNGLSSTALANTTSFAQPIGSISAVSRTIRPMSATASIFMPALVDATFTLEHTSPVCVSACGIELISRRSLSVKPLCASAVKPPMKLTPRALAALSSVSASGT